MRWVLPEDRWFITNICVSISILIQYLTTFTFTYRSTRLHDSSPLNQSSAHKLHLQENPPPSRQCYHPLLYKVVTMQKESNQLDRCAAVHLCTYLAVAGADSTGELFRSELVPRLPLELSAPVPIHQHLERPMPPDVRLQWCLTDGGRVLHVRLAGTVDSLDLYPANVAGVA